MTCPLLRYMARELRPHPVQDVRQGHRLLSEGSDGYTQQAMRGPDRKTRSGSDAASIEPRPRVKT